MKWLPENSPKMTKMWYPFVNKHFSSHIQVNFNFQLQKAILGLDGMILTLRRSTSLKSWVVLSPDKKVKIVIMPMFLF